MAFVVVVLDVSVENLNGMSGFGSSTFLPRYSPVVHMRLLETGFLAAFLWSLHLFPSCTSVILW